MEVKDDQCEQESGTQDGLRIFRAERVERKPQRKVFPDWILPEQGEGTRCGEEGRGLGFGWAPFNKSEGAHFQRGPVAAKQPGKSVDSPRRLSAESERNCQLLRPCSAPLYHDPCHLSRLAHIRSHSDTLRPLVLVDSINTYHI